MKKLVLAVAIASGALFGLSRSSCARFLQRGWSAKPGDRGCR